MSAEKLIWHERGIGFYPCDPKEAPYDAEYFEKYVGYEATEIGQKINEARLELVAGYLRPTDPLIDIGIGSGAFIKGRPGTKGYDVNPVARDWLRCNGLFRSPYIGDENAVGCDNVTCWDSLEHIETPVKLLRKVQEHIFVSIPIFEDKKHVLRSKHFRPTEHYWYFTHEGFVGWMFHHGFGLLECNRMESDLGREDIGTYVFRRTR